MSESEKRKRRAWMVDHSAQVIAIYNGTAGGTKNTIHYAEKHGVRVEVCSALPKHV